MSERTKATAKKPEARIETKSSNRQPSELFQPLHSPVDQILQLQKTIGNYATGRFFAAHAIATKLKIGARHDICEQEADRVAEHVMCMPEHAVHPEPT